MLVSMGSCGSPSKTIVESRTRPASLSWLYHAFKPNKYLSLCLPLALFPYNLSVAAKLNHSLLGIFTMMVSLCFLLVCLWFNTASQSLVKLTIQGIRGRGYRWHLLLPNDHITEFSEILDIVAPPKNLPPLDEPHAVIAFI